jgi:competence protein ComEA
VSRHRTEPWDLGRAGVRALAAFAAVVAVVAAVLAWRARPAVEPLGAGPDPPVGSVAPPAVSAPTVLVVAVTGKVRRPGLVRVPAGARVADAIEAAGGALPGTDLAAVNLARKVTDGELIVVGVAAPPGQAAGPGATAPVNLNTATLEQLQTLPGVGPVLAQRIIAYRDEHGGFTSVSELRQVSGIGDARYQELKDRVMV